jgi:hypothetical protein
LIDPPHEVLGFWLLLGRTQEWILKKSPPPRLPEGGGIMADAIRWDMKKWEKKRENVNKKRWKKER